jgi:hypothetical protein
VRPHWKYPLVLLAFGLIVPLSIALVCAMVVAAAVATAGGVSAGAPDVPVMNKPKAAGADPTEIVAITDFDAVSMTATREAALTAT